MHGRLEGKDMRKTVTTIAVVLVFGGAAFGWWLLQNQPASAPKDQTTQRVSKSEKKADPEEHNFTDVDFARKMIVHNHIEMSGNHSCMRSAAAVNSVPRVTDQVSQYNQVMV